MSVTAAGTHCATSDSASGTSRWSVRRCRAVMAASRPSLSEPSKLTVSVVYRPGSPSAASAATLAESIPALKKMPSRTSLRSCSRTASRRRGAIDSMASARVAGTGPLGEIGNCQ